MSEYDGLTPSQRRRLRKRLKLEAKPIGYFNSKWRFMSNFYLAEVEFEGQKYPSTEHAYQAAKFLDSRVRCEIVDLERPSQAKFYTRGMKLRSDWEKVKLEIMEKLVRQKFTRHEVLRQLLVATNPRPLVEGNRWHDNFWGQCNCPKCEGREGLNHLGRILTKVREELL